MRERPKPGLISGGGRTAFALGGGLSLLETSRVLRHANPQVAATVYAGLTDDGVSALGEKLAVIGGSSR